MGRPRGSNIWFLKGETYCSKLKHGTVVISKESLPLVQNYKWFTKLASSNKKYYVYSHFIGNKKIMIHRHILNVTDKSLVDHINGDTLDNRISNIRIVNRLQNNVNSKKRKNSKTLYKGVTQRPSGRFGCYISLNNKNFCLGTFDTQEEAALAYNKKAKELFGKYAKLNNVEKNNE